MFPKIAAEAEMAGPAYSVQVVPLLVTAKEQRAFLTQAAAQLMNVWVLVPSNWAEVKVI